MKFYYENSIGDSGIFQEKDLIKAIYTAWNIEADLYLITEHVGKIDSDTVYQQSLIFAPYEDNEFNSELLNEFGYYMEDGEKYREIKDIKTNEIKKYNWNEVEQLI